MTTQEIVSKLWNLCNVLRDDGITYHQYVTELTYILFLKMAKETDKESKFAEGITLQENKDGQELTPEQKTQNHEKQIVMEYSWDKLISKSGVELLGGKALPIQRQAQILQARPSQLLWPGADDVQRRNFIDMGLYIVSEGI